MPTAAGDQFVAPYATRVVFRVTIKSLSNLYANRIKTAVFNAIKTSVGETRNKGEDYVQRYAARKTGYLQSSIIEVLKEDAHADDPWTISVGSDAPYAQFVNRMRGVNWTNPSTVEGFFGLYTMFLRQQGRNLVRQAVINAVNYATYQQQVKIKNA